MSWEKEKGKFDDTEVEVLL